MSFDIGADLQRAYDDGYEAGKRDSAPRWVRCEDELPDDNEIVLVCNDVGFVYCAFYNAIGHKWYIANNTQYDSWTWEPDAMYWMPLPKPPQEVQE